MYWLWCFRPWASSWYGWGRDDWACSSKASLGGNSSSSKWCLTTGKTKKNDGWNGEKGMGSQRAGNWKVWHHHIKQALPYVLFIICLHISFGSNCLANLTHNFLSYRYKFIFLFHVDFVIGFEYEKIIYIKENY